MVDADAASTLLKLGLSMILIGLGFKVAAAPFQIWTPDVYEGAPTPVTALFSAGPKAAAFALLLRIFATVPAATHFWFWAFWILAVLTMFAGNLGALVQTNIKRLLAYSSIAHAGYILVALPRLLRWPRRTVGSSGRVCSRALLSSQLCAGKLGAFTIVSQLGGPARKISRWTITPGSRSASRRCRNTEYLPAVAPRAARHSGFFGKFYIFRRR